jgi:protein-tyrosine phosphatase
MPDMAHAGAFQVQSFGSSLLWVVLRPRGGGHLDEDVRALKASGVSILVCLLTSDEQIELDLRRAAECCRAAGIEYVSVPIPDFGVPTDLKPFEQAIVKAIQAFSRAESVAVHCREGIGRSSLFATAVLVATGIPTEQALVTASNARGLPVPDTRAQRAWLVHNAQRFATLGSGS